MTTQTPLSEAIATVRAGLLEGKIQPKTRGLSSLSDELQSLRKAGLSTHTIARHITAAGVPISQSSVWRCLRKSKLKAKAKSKAKATPKTPSPTATVVTAAPSKPSVAATLSDDAEAAALLAELQEPVAPRRQVQFPALKTTL